MEFDEEQSPFLNKPEFTEGELVAFGCENGCCGTGKIRGKAISGLIDLWIIEVLDSNIDKELYPWSCITMSHTLIWPASKLTLHESPSSCKISV